MEKNKLNIKGFTLVELLVVIGVLGVLAVVVILALNPAQQFARTRDAGRKSAVTQLGHALEAFATARGGGAYVTENNTWISNCVSPNTCLVAAGEIAVAPTLLKYGAGILPCSNAMQNNYCYDYNAAAGTAVIYARLESLAESSKCTVANPVPYFVYSTADARGGLVCSVGVAEPVAGTQTFID